MQPSFRLLGYFTVFYVATLLIFNVLACKLWQCGPFIFTAGIILVPVSYIFGDILTEVYGYAATRRIIWLGFACNALMIACIEIAILLPPAPQWGMQNEFVQLLGNTPRIATSSLLAYLAGEFVNSFVIAKMKLVHQGRHLWARLMLSTLAGQFIDSTIFILGAFYGKIPEAQLVVMIASVTAFKVIFEVICSPLTHRVVHFVKMYEKCDAYDGTIQFTPFTLRG